MKKIMKRYFKFEENVLILCLGVMGLALFGQVVMRFIVNRPLMWSEELVRYIQIWITFLGMGYGMRNKSHISMVMLYNKFNKSVQQLLSILSNIIVIACFILFMPKAWEFIALQNQIKSSAMQIRMSIVYFPLVIGSFVYIVYSIGDCIERFKVLLGSDECDEDIRSGMEEDKVC